MLFTVSNIAKFSFIGVPAYHIVAGNFDYRFVFFAERTRDGIVLLDF